MWLRRVHKLVHGCCHAWVQARCANPCAVTCSCEWGNNHMTPLMHAVRARSPSLVDFLLRNKICARINAVDASRNTALLYAVLENHVAMVTALLHHHADITATDADGCTALMHAARHGNTRLAHLLLNNGVAVNAQTSSQQSALAVAVELNHTDVVTLLLDHGADASVQGRMMWVRRTGEDREIGKYIADGNGPLLDIAVANGNATIVKALLEKTECIDPEFALLAAVYCNHAAMLQLLLSNGVSAKGTSLPLMTACALGNVAAMTLLLDAGANVNAHCCRDTAIDGALRRGHSAAVALLLKYGATTHALTKEGECPLTIVLRKMLTRPADTDAWRNIANTMLEQLKPNCRWMGNCLIFFYFLSLVA